MENEVTISTDGGEPQPVVVPDVPITIADDVMCLHIANAVNMALPRCKRDIVVTVRRRPQGVSPL